MLYKTISNQGDAERLQDDLDNVQEWTDTWQMKFNAKKVYLLSMHSKRDPTLNKYRLKDEEIVKTPHHSYLGVEIQDDGKWSKHVVKTVPKKQIELLDLYVDILVGARKPLKRHYTQPWLDLIWDMHLGHGTLISKRIKTN